MMELIKPNYYNDFSCLAGRCPATCCAHWEVVIDPAHLRLYQSLPGELGDQIRSAMVELDGELCFGLDHGNCRMLRPDGLCEIQRQLGHDALSQSCSLFPRFVTELGLRREIGLSLSCPEAARLILSGNEPFSLSRKQVDAPLSALHELSPALIVTVRNLREEALAIAQNAALPFSMRCIQIARLAAACHMHPRPHILRQAMEAGDAEPTPAGPGGLACFRKALQKLFSSLEPLQPDFQHSLLQALEPPLNAPSWKPPIAQTPHFWEKLLCCSIYKYFLRSVFDRGIWQACVFSLLLPLLLRQLIFTEKPECLEELLPLVWNLSRELEHSEENMSILWQSFLRRQFRPEAICAIFAAINEKGQSADKAVCGLDDSAAG